MGFLRSTLFLTKTTATQFGSVTFSASMEQQQLVEAAKSRCLRVIHTIQTLLPCAGPGGGSTTAAATTNNNITESCKRTLLKLAESELHFLSSSSSSNFPPTLSVNIGHVEAVIHILRQPSITAVSRVCKPIPIKDSKSRNNNLAVHVDIVCTFNQNPVWIIVSDRNPKYLSWFPGSKRSGNKGLKSRLQQLLDAAQSTLTMKPCSIVLFFSQGVTDFVYEKLRDEFGASKLELEFDLFNFDLCEEELEGGEWINVVVNGRSFGNACFFEIKIDSSREHAALGPKSESKRSLINNPAEQELEEELTKEDLIDDLCCLISGMKLSPLKLRSVDFVVPGVLTGVDSGGSVDLINFDTTALIAIVSGISNGCCEKLLATPEAELRRRFKGNYEFVIAQVLSEIQNPIFAEMASIVHGKRGIICESVLSEFKELVSSCGGPNEKFRADKILKHLMVVPDSPSERMMGLPTTRKLALKNKVVFGTGDYWHAPTLTANMAFVRAVSQTAMSLFTIAHRPRALTGD